MLSRVWVGLFVSLAAMGVSGTAKADKDALKYVLDGMENNRFVVDPEGDIDRQLTLLVGPYFYEMRSRTTSEETFCWLRFTEPGVDAPPVMLGDQHCDGTPELRFQGRYIYDLRENDSRLYTQKLIELGYYIEAMQKYKSWNPDPKLAILPDMRELRKNLRLVDDMLGILNHSPAAKRERKQYSITFLVGEYTLAFHANHNGKDFLRCFIAEESMSEDNPSSFMFSDENCNGSVEYFSKNGSDFRKSNPAGNMLPYQSMLQDLKRFMDATMMYHAG